MSRVKNTARNIFFGYVSSIVSLLLGFVSRTIFIQILGNTFLGINGLFTNVLGILSFAELGLGTAMNFSLYKPVAENDTEKVKSIMNFYKVAYQYIAFAVTIIGLLLLPFLPYIMKGTEGIDHIYVYYLIYLFNTVTTYLVSYKFSLINANQKNYIFTNITTLTSFVTIVLQMIALLVFRSFMAYLLTAAIIGLLQKIFVSIYLNRLYPYLLEKNVTKLSKEELTPIKNNVKALIWHKIGEVAVYQTDNIVISAFISVGTVGLISNYNLLITSVSGFIVIIFNSVTSSLGNLIATEEKGKQYEIFKVYRFVAFWMYGFSSIAFMLLLSPFITLWLGDEMVISTFTVFLIILNYYMTGHRICINNIKSAGGVFNQDKYVAIIQAVVNLVVSIIMVKLIGLPGVYIGTLAQGIISSVVKPIIVYKNMFHVSPVEYFIDAAKFIGMVFLAGVVCIQFQQVFMKEITLVSLFVMCVVVLAVPNIIFLIAFSKRMEFKYLVNLINVKFKGRMNHV